MATQPVVLLIHGMGSATAPSNQALGSFGKQFVEAANSSLRRYPQHSEDKITNYVQVREFYYNDIFDKIREKMQEDATLKSRLGAIEALYGGSFLEQFAGHLNGWESKFGQDDFFYTHWLDVLFYTTFIGGAVRARLAQQLAGLIAEVGNKKVHVVAHSLGTAVLHDTLSQLYHLDSGPPAPGGVPTFSPTSDQLESVWMVSNISLLIDSVVGLSNPLSPTTTVKPGAGGCTKVFANVRHKLDPFTLIRRFKPQNDGSWVTPTTYKLRYKRIATDIVTDANTHSFPQYISDPDVAYPLLRELMGSKLKATRNQREVAVEAYLADSIQGAFARLQQEFSEIEISDLSTIDEFLTAGEQFRGAIDEIREQLEGIEV